MLFMICDKFILFLPSYTSALPISTGDFDTFLGVLVVLSKNEAMNNIRPIGTNMIELMRRDLENLSIQDELCFLPYKYIYPITNPNNSNMIPTNKYVKFIYYIINKFNKLEILQKYYLVK